MSTLPLSIKSVSSFVSLYKFTSRFKMSIHVYGAKIAAKCDWFVIGGQNLHIPSCKRFHTKRK